MLGERLAENSMILNAVYPVKMPDNYVVMYSIQSEEEEEKILKVAEEKLDQIRVRIDDCEETKWQENAFAGIMTSCMYPLYAKGRKTKKFRTDERCVSCGVCAGKCPSRAIELIDGHVVWVKDQCAHCMACATCNAIQYGKQTVGRRRYKHPMLRKKVCH